MKPVSSAALLAAASLALGFSSANAADLGGDCCADLEERVAELEATTARKGNRKVSLTITGQVNEALMFWDDGDESNIYVVTNDTNRTRFNFLGKAKIDADWEAGYLLEIGVRTARSDRVNQITDDGVDNGFDLRHSSWYVKSKTYGQLVVGQTSSTADGITEINLGGNNDAAKLSDVEDYLAGFLLRAKGSKGDSGLGTLDYRDLLDVDGNVPGEGDRQNLVRYNSPEFAGFTASAAWGEDDYWDAALRYAGEFNGVKIAAGIAYGENTERGSSSGSLSPSTSDTARGGIACPAQANRADRGGLGFDAADCNEIGGSISVQHVPSGVFVSFAAGRLEDELLGDTIAFDGTGADDESHFYAVMAGVDAKLTPLGKTTFYAEYFEHDGGANNADTVDAGDDPALNPFGTDSRIFSTELQVIGGGVVQHIDAAAMALYTSYRHIEGDLTVKQGASGAGDLADVELEDLDVVMSGAIIKF